MGFVVVKSLRINDVVEVMDLQGALSGGSVDGSFKLFAPNYVMGDGGGSAGQIVRLTASANIVTVAGIDSPSSAENIVGMLTADAVSGLSCTILEMGRYDGIYTAHTIGRKYLGTAGILVDVPPLVSAGSIRQPMGFAPAASATQFRIGEMKIN
jgi:hypothetical protein